MSEDRVQQETEAEKKTNTKLAIGVGVLGLGAFVAIYVLFFLIMIFKPGWMFSIIPIPSITSSALSDGSRTYVLSQKIDMSAVSPQENRKPETKFFISALEGAALGEPQEIPAYEQAIGADNRLVFLSEGKYRIHEGTTWTEKATPEIGKDPRGVLTSFGLYVLSDFENGARIAHIADNTATTIPVPKQLLDAEKKTCSCTQIVWYQGQLCLFWSTGNSIAWTIWNNKAWEPVASSPFSGGFQVVSDGQKIYFFHRKGEGFDRVLDYSVFTDNAWNEPTRLSVPSGFVHWDVFIQQGKLMLFISEITTQTLYTIEDRNLVNPIRLKSPFPSINTIGRIALVVVFSNLLVFLGIGGVSALMNRFKSRSWKDHETQYEFASLFRRFVAYFIDGLLLLLLPVVGFALLFPLEDFPRNPVRFFVVFMSLFVFFFVGGFLYNVLLEGLLGQTLGKKICGIRVLKEDFTPCGLKAGFLRNLLRIADSFFYYLVGAIALAGTFKWQRVGDIVAETIVVREKKK